jgi:osmotically inducible protein OsmC
VDESWTVVSSRLIVIGRVPGASAPEFVAAAQDAKEGCPISRALAGNVEISVEATLEE